MSKKFSIKAFYVICVLTCVFCLPSTGYGAEVEEIEGTVVQIGGIGAHGPGKCVWLDSSAYTNPIRVRGVPDKMVSSIVLGDCMTLNALQDGLVERQGETFYSFFACELVWWSSVPDCSLPHPMLKPWMGCLHDRLPRCNVVEACE